MQYRKWRALSAAWWLVGACGPLELGRAPGDAGVGTSDGGVLELPTPGVVSDLFPAGTAPTVEFSAPEAGASVPRGLVRVTGSASDDHGVASVLVRSGKNSRVVARSTDGFASWSADVPALPGSFTVEALAYDGAGQPSPTESLPLVGAFGGADDAAPTVQILRPEDGSSPLKLLALVEGEASDDRAVVDVSVTLNGQPLTERSVDTSDNFAHWSRLVPLVAGEDNLLEFTAVDQAGHTGSARVTLRGRADTDREPPELTVTSPADGSSIDSATVTIAGSARDNVDVREVKVRVGTGPSEARIWSAYSAANTRSAFAPFDLTIPAPSGAFVIEVRAIDQNGLSAAVEVAVSNARIAPWTEERAIPLRLKENDDPGPLHLTLDKAGIDEVFTADIQRDVRLLELDTTALVTSAVNKIKVSCGTLWQQNNADPRHDCSGTDYGKDRTPQIPWQRTPEYAMVRILTMTPANVVVTGTSLENLSGLADALGIGGGFHSILAETLGIAPTREIVTTANVVKALQTAWMQSHPEVLPGAKLPITLYDSMHDLAPLATRFGPSGSHPGLLDPAFPPYSKIMLDNFEMQLEARSNLRWFDGIDLSGTLGAQAGVKDYLAMVVDTTGPTFDDVLEFDFNDPAKFDITGLAARPLVDMRMLLRENASYVRSCTTLANGGCKANLPSSPINGYVWTTPRHQIEFVLGTSAYEEYKARRGYSKTYDLIFPAATVTVGAGSDPAGWSTYETLLNLGEPPPDQYLWETILEVAEVALHRVGNTTFPEGSVNVAFSLDDVDVGLTADTIRSAIRPEMQAQRQKLSDRLLGDYQKNSGPVDLYYRKTRAGAPALFFVAASDPRSTTSYDYAKPGFYADEALTEKLSVDGQLPESTAVHQVLPVSAGERTVYAADDSGGVYRLRIVVGASTDEITVYTAKKVQ
jgi:Bacterial Ig domain